MHGFFKPLSDSIACANAVTTRSALPLSSPAKAGQSCPARCQARSSLSRSRLLEWRILYARSVRVLCPRPTTHTTVRHHRRSCLTACAPKAGPANQRLCNVRTDRGTQSKHRGCGFGVREEDSDARATMRHCLHTAWDISTLSPTPVTIPACHHGKPYA
jgi:hypothetical protein